jgi:hypothetical protein
MALVTSVASGCATANRDVARVVSPIGPGDQPLANASVAVPVAIGAQPAIAHPAAAPSLPQANSAVAPAMALAAPSVASAPMPVVAGPVVPAINWGAPLVPSAAIPIPVVAPPAFSAPTTGSAFHPAGSPVAVVPQPGVAAPAAGAAMGLKHQPRLGAAVVDVGTPSFLSEQPTAGLRLQPRTPTDQVIYRASGVGDGAAAEPATPKLTVPGPPTDDEPPPPVRVQPH